MRYMRPFFQLHWTLGKITKMTSDERRMRIQANRLRTKLYVFWNKRQPTGNHQMAWASMPVNGLVVALEKLELL